MTEAATIADAVALAAKIHRTQTDKAGRPYILHPLRVMLSLTDDAARMVAVLHDVVEDAPKNAPGLPGELDDLRAQGFSEEVVCAVDALTKREAEDYEAFIERVAKNPLATRVKLADLEDNMNLTRFAELTNDDLQRLGRYHRAWRRLKSA